MPLKVLLVASIVIKKMSNRKGWLPYKIIIKKREMKEQKTKQRNKYNKTETDTENKLVVARGESGGGDGQNWWRGLGGTNYQL